MIYDVLRERHARGLSVRTYIQREMYRPEFKTGGV